MREQGGRGTERGHGRREGGRQMYGDETDAAVSSSRAPAQNASQPLSSPFPLCSPQTLSSHCRPFVSQKKEGE